MCDEVLLDQACFQKVLEEKDIFAETSYILSDTELTVQEIRKRARSYCKKKATKKEKEQFEALKDYKYTRRYAYDIFIKYFNNQDALQEWLTKYGVRRKTFDLNVKYYIDNYGTEEEKKDYDRKMEECHHQELSTKQIKSIEEKSKLQKKLPKRPMYVKLFDDILQNPTQFIQIFKGVEVFNCSYLREKIADYIKWKIDKKGYVSTNICNENAKEVSWYLRKLIDEYEQYLNQSDILSMKNTKETDDSLPDFSVIEKVYQDYVEEAPLIMDDFLKKHGITSPMFKRYKETYAKNNCQRYYRLEKIRQLKEYNHLLEFNKRKNRMLYSLLYGVEERGVWRKFDILDYYKLFPYSYRQFSSILRKLDVHKKEAPILNKIFQRQGNDTYINVAIEKQSHSMYQKGDLQIEITPEIKEKIITSLQEEGYPLTDSIYQAALQRYVAMQIAVSKEKPKKRELSKKTSIGK